MRVHELPERMLALFAEVPGVEVFRPVGDNVRGRRSAIAIRCVCESCASVLRQGALLRLLRHARRGRRACASRRRWCRRSDLIGGGFDLGERAEPVEHTPREPDKLEVQLKLVASATARRRVTATLVPWAHADRLRKLVYALPPTMLATYRVAAIAEGLFVIGEQGIDGIPIGDMFQEAAPSIYVPLGMEFYPRVGAEVLTDHIGGVNGRYVVFPRGGRPLALEHAAFEPLGRRALARLEVDPRQRDARMPPPRATTPATVVNEELGTLPLWGFSADRKRRQATTMAFDPAQWLHHFVLPLVAGGDVRVAHVIGARELKLLLESDLDRDESAQRIAEARHAIASELVLTPPEPALDEEALRLAGADAEPLVPFAPRHQCTDGDAAPPARGVGVRDRAGDAAAARSRPRRQPHRRARARRAPLDAAPPVRPRPRRRARQLLGGQARVSRRRAAVAAAQVAGAAPRARGALARHRRRRGDGRSADEADRDGAAGCRRR